MGHEYVPFSFNFIDLINQINVKNDANLFSNPLQLYCEWKLDSKKKVFCLFFFFFFVSIVYSFYLCNFGR
jgi:hypothetical protein